MHSRKFGDSGHNSLCFKIVMKEIRLVLKLILELEENVNSINTGEALVKEHFAVN